MKRSCGCLLIGVALCTFCRTWPSGDETPVARSEKSQKRGTLHHGYTQYWYSYFVQSIRFRYCSNKGALYFCHRYSYVPRHQVIQVLTPAETCSVILHQGPAQDQDTPNIPWPARPLSVHCMASAMRYASQELHVCLPVVHGTLLDLTRKTRRQSSCATWDEANTMQGPFRSWLFVAHVA